MISTWPNGFSLHEGLIIRRPSIPVLVAKEEVRRPCLKAKRLTIKSGGFKWGMKSNLKQ